MARSYVYLIEFAKFILRYPKKEAAEEMSIASGMKYLIYTSSLLMKQNVLDDPGFCQTYFVQDKDGQEYEIDIDRAHNIS